MNENNMRKRVFQVIILTLFAIPLVISGEYLYHTDGLFSNQISSEIGSDSTGVSTSDGISSSDKTVEKSANGESISETESEETITAVERPLIIAEREYFAPYENKQIKMMEEINTTLYFTPQSFKIVEEDLAILDEFVKVAVQFPDEIINIEGHANGFPNFENSILEQSLSQDRINSVSNYITSRGIDAARIKVYSCGSGQPLSLKQEDQALNDRVEIYFEAYNAKGLEAK